MTQQAPQTKTETRQDPATEQRAAEIVQATPTWQKALGGATRPDNINDRLRFLSRGTRDVHLISPATAVAQIPEGTSVAFSAVFIDIERETYDVGYGKRGLSKPALDRIAGALGVSWVREKSGRIDDRSDAHYVAWKSVGLVRNFDGTYREISGDKEMDLREGSAALEGQSKKQLAEQRKHIQAHAETKARLRAIRSLGLSASYTVADLEKPFVMAALQFHGRSENPETRRIFAEAIARNFLGGSAALYGSEPAPSQAAAQSAPALPGEVFQAPPPVGSKAREDDDPVYAPARPGSSPDSEERY